MIRYCLTIFLSAFLLFQVQPLIARYILPWFGGSPAAWTTCLLFFQSILLLGYAYAHGIVRLFSPRAQSVIHSVAIAGTIFLLPITPRADWKPTELGDPTWQILILLLFCVGAPFLFLSATSPLIQSWFARTHQTASPYRLYALSNVGSLLGLLTYPLLVERYLPLESQATLWSAGYVLFAFVCVASAAQMFFGNSREPSPENPAEETNQIQNVNGATAAGQRPTLAIVMLWLALTSCSSVMLLATTNVMCRDVASVPFLWVLPLALYLMSFIVCFDREQWYRRGLFGILLIVFVGTHVLFEFYGLFFPLWLQILHLSCLLSVCCFICHGELVRTKPPARFLTLFYLTISAGGALGGILVTLVAPIVFNGYYELQFALAACVVLLLLIYRLDEWNRMAPEKVQRQIYKLAWVTIFVVPIIVLSRWGISTNADLNFGTVVEQDRNFYGALKVFRKSSDDPQLHRMVLSHGTTVHGFQYQSEEKRQIPTSYYSQKSGIGIAIQRHPKYLAATESFRFGVIGLGTGTLACFARNGDYLRFYEIDPLVVKMADQYFSFQQDAKRRGADVDVYIGDARIVIENQLARDDSERFDILAVDAFSSDAIPVHLLTWECFELYSQHVTSDGIIAFHVSNRHLDLAPVIRKFAEKSGRKALQISHRPSTNPAASSGKVGETSDWILVTNNDQFIGDETVHAAITPWGPAARPPLLWTDDFSNLFQVLR